jgi:hypothetical protein
MPQMKNTFHNKMLPSEFLKEWLVNDYLYSKVSTEEYVRFKKYYSNYSNQLSRHVQKSYNFRLSPVIT